jgi:hypothetical protein
VDHLMRLPPERLSHFTPVEEAGRLKDGPARDSDVTWGLRRINNPESAFPLMNVKEAWRRNPTRVGSS